MPAAARPRMHRWGMVLLVWLLGTQAIPLALVATWHLYVARVPGAISRQDLMLWLLLSFLSAGGLAVIGAFCASARRRGATAYRYRSAVWLGAKGYAVFMAAVVAVLYLLDGAQDGALGFIATWGVVAAIGATVNLINLFAVVPLVIRSWYRILNGAGSTIAQATR